VTGIIVARTEVPYTWLEDRDNSRELLEEELKIILERNYFHILSSGKPYVIQEFPATLHPSDTGIYTIEKKALAVLRNIEDAEPGDCVDFKELGRYHLPRVVTEFGAFDLYEELIDGIEVKYWRRC
jgi:hypothetical protein